MASTVVSNFSRQVARRPPLIIADRAIPWEANRMLDAMQSMSSYLSNVSTFHARFTIVEPRWARIMLWSVALLKPLDSLIDPQLSVDEHHLGTASRCIAGVFSFLTCIASPGKATNLELKNFVANLANHPQIVAAMAKAWVAFFVRRWTIAAHRAVTRFLVLFGHMVEDTSHDRSFRDAVNSVCPGPALLPTWSTAAIEICASPPPYSPECATVAASRGLLLAAITVFFHPLPRLDEIHITLDHALKLWNQLMVNTYPEDLCYISIHSLANFSSLVISGGPNWAAKALDANLLYLIAKTLAWLQTSLTLELDGSLCDIFEKIVRQLLLYSIYRPVQQGVLRNMKRAEAPLDFTVYLGAGTLWWLWEQLVGEFEESTRVPAEPIGCIFPSGLDANVPVNARTALYRKDNRLSPYSSGYHTRKGSPKLNVNDLYHRAEDSMTQMLNVQNLEVVAGHSRETCLYLAYLEISYLDRYYEYPFF
ncbi:hypothetical protein FB446DRAFT_708945 [Lentinula raphanica]|nr:hypothetical protein FB446DRAFT_708945 [Lentinula raphanica]